MFLSKANLFSWFQKLGSTGEAGKKPLNKPELDPHHNPVAKTGSPLFAWFLQNWAKSAESEPVPPDSPTKPAQTTHTVKGGSSKTGDSPLLRLAHSALDRKNTLPDESANKDAIPRDEGGLEQAIGPDDVPGFDGGRNRRKLGLAPILNPKGSAGKAETPILAAPSAVPLPQARSKDATGPVSNQALTAKLNAMIAPDHRPQSEVLVQVTSVHAEKVMKVANPRLEPSEKAVLTLKGQEDQAPHPDRKSLTPQTQPFAEKTSPKPPALELGNPQESVRRGLPLSGSPTKSPEIVQERLASIIETPALEKRSFKSPSGSPPSPATPERVEKSTTGPARPTVSNSPEGLKFEPNPTSRSAEPEPGNRLGSEPPKAIPQKTATPTSTSTATKTGGPNIAETISSKNPAPESVAKEHVVPMGWSEKVVSTANTPAPGAAPTLSNQLQTGVFEAIQQSPKQLVLKLQPDHLGELTIKIGLERERVHAQIGCQNDTVAAMIHDSKSDLDNALKQRGFQLNQFDIHQQGQNSGQSGQHPSGHPTWQRNGSAPQTGPAPTQPAPSVETSNPVRPHYVPGGPLNLLV